MVHNSFAGGVYANTPCTPARSLIRREGLSAHAARACALNNIKKILVGTTWYLLDGCLPGVSHLLWHAGRCASMHSEWGSFRLVD